MKDWDLFALLLAAIFVVLAYNYHDKVSEQNFHIRVDPQGDIH